MNDPRTIAMATHREYYASGSYDIDRLNWTISNFVSVSAGGKVLEIGCGDGSLLQLLVQKGIDATGVDASSSGIERCIAKGLSARCLDVSTEPLPFPQDCFDLIVSLETFEHLMNVHFAAQEVRRVLRPGGRFLCSVPNPLTGHPYLYPGLFEYKNFCKFLEQSGFAIERVDHWEWAPRETILPRWLRRVPVLNSRVVAGGFRTVLENCYRMSGAFPYFCYWLWTFDCRKSETNDRDVFENLSSSTKPGSGSQFKATR